MALNYDKTKEMRICFKKETPDIPPITINDIHIELVHSTRILGVTISQDLMWQIHIDDRYHNKSFTTTILHHSTQACWNRAASSRQHIYYNHPYCHQICLPSVAYQSNNETNKPARKHSEKGHAHYIFGMRYTDAIATARIPTLADRREALGRSLFATMQQTNHKLHHLLPPPGHPTLFVTLARTVFLAVRPIASRTHLCRMDCIIGSEWTSAYLHTNITGFEL